MNTVPQKKVQSILKNKIPSSRIHPGSSAFPTLGRCVEISGLGIAQKVVFVVGETAEEESTADQDDCGCPPKAVGPVIDVKDCGVGVKVESLGVLHRVNYQGDDLEHSSQGQEASDYSQEHKHLGSTEGEEGEDETDHQDDKATEKHGGGCPSPRVVHEALAAIRAGSAAAALVETSPPQRGRLEVGARLQPAAAGERDDVEGDGAEQEQGQDPPAALAGQAAAQHLDGGGAGEKDARGSDAAESGRRARAARQKGRGGGGAAPRPHLDSGDSERAAPTCPAGLGRGPRGRGGAELRLHRVWVSFPAPGGPGGARPRGPRRAPQAAVTRAPALPHSRVSLLHDPRIPMFVLGLQRVHVLICATPAKYLAPDVG